MSAAVDIGAYATDDAQIGFNQSAGGSSQQKSVENKKPEPVKDRKSKSDTATVAATKPVKSTQRKTETATAKTPSVQSDEPVTKIRPETTASSAQKKAETDKIEVAIATPTLTDKPKSKNNKLEWEVRRALRFGGSCVLESNKIDFFDGHDNTGLMFRVVNDELYLLTKSNIDISFKDIGVQVGDNAFMHAERVVDDQNVVIKNELPALITQLRKTKQARIQLRFWPTYPATQTYSEVVNLDGLVSAYDEYQSCKRGN